MTTDAMKRTFTLILAALAAAALFGGLVYGVLVAAHVSEPAAATVYGLTPRRFWATAAAGLALVGVIIGGLALRRSAGRIGTSNGRLGAIVALALTVRLYAPWATSPLHVSGRKAMGTTG